MDIDARLLQPEKALLPTDVSFDVKFTVLKPEHPWNV